MLPQVASFGKWLRRKSPHASTSTHYSNDLDLFFTWAGATPETITIRDVDRFIDHCQQIGHAINTINRRLTAIRSFYTFLTFEPGIDAPPNPVLPRRHFVRQGRHLPRDVQDADIERLFAVVRSVRDRAMFLLMLRCGLRVGEVHRLSLSDLYLQPAPGHLPRLWIEGKNDTQRIVYVSHQALTALNRWLDARPEAQTQAVFLSRTGDRVSIRTIQDRLARYGRQAGIHMTCHQFRHTFARHMAEARVPVTTIQKLMGHRHLSTTQIYLHITDPVMQAEYEAGIVQVAQRLALAEDVQ